MKNIILTFSAVIIGAVSYAQQEYSFTNYFEMNSFFNPAATGTERTQNIMGIFRKQWVGFNGTPVGGGILYENQLSDYNMGIGGFVFSDKVGETIMTNVVANYSYSLKLDRDHSLAFGIDAGVDIFTTDYDRLTYWDDDAMFDQQQATVTVPRAGVGAHFYTDEYYVGISVPRLLNYNNSSALSISSENYPSIVSNYYFTSGYKFPVGSDFEMQVNLLGKYTHKVVPQGDLNFMTTYREIIGLGIGYKSIGFFSTYLHYSYDDVVTIGYAFDISLTHISNYSSGSHELMVKYRIPRSKKTIRSSIN